MVLGVLTRQRPRPVDWRPAAASLRPVLAGTNLMAYQTSLHALLATRVAPDLAADLLPGAADLLVAHLKATHEPPRNWPRTSSNTSVARATARRKSGSGGWTSTGGRGERKPMRVSMVVRPAMSWIAKQLKPSQVE